MRMVIYIAALSGITFATVNGLATMKQCLSSADSVLSRSQHLSNTSDATALLSEIRGLKGQSFINKSCMTNVLIPAENNCLAFLATQNTSSPLNQAVNTTHPTVVNHTRSNRDLHTSRSVSSPLPQVTSTPTSSVAAKSSNTGSISTPSNPVNQSISSNTHQAAANSINIPAVQHNVVKTQSAQLNPIAPQQNNSAQTAINPNINLVESIKSIWHNVSPVIRYPIEASVSGISYLYSVNKPAAFAAGVGLAGTAVFLSWAGNKCLTNYNTLYCNPFRDPSFSERAAQFFGI